MRDIATAFVMLDAVAAGCTPATHEDATASWRCEFLSTARRRRHIPSFTVTLLPTFTALSGPCCHATTSSVSGDADREIGTQ